MNILKTKTIKW